ncbi:hypothetical protein BJ322DRAFT_1109133 [Thelephora terrestris]|uniref:DUF6532 domain-containing protein n=1 Tax=Thelephora terrestris TaxID=56493 RepID=A0A9P6L661_9AGAM|nr:hypothetical protein BJ322DRAFT_1109133 [Thelephora terrestris]
MPRGQGSMAEPVPRRSNRANRGRNGRDVQLDRLGEQLAVSTRQNKRPFIPEDGLVLENNVLAPVPKKRRSKKNQQPVHPQSQPSAVQPPSRPCQPPVTDDERFGFRLSPPTQRAIGLPTPAYSQLSHNSSSSPHFRMASLSDPPLVSQPPSRPHTSSPPLPGAELSDSNSDNDAEADDLDIDEQSDDEDDRRAQVFLQNSSNQLPVAPVSQSPAPAAQVTTATATPQPQPATQGHLSFANVGAEESVLQNHYNRNHPPRAPRFQQIQVAPRSLKRQPPPPVDVVDTSPRTLEHYPPQWQEVITNAKRAFRAYVAGTCGFPDGVEGMDEARECLQDAVEVYCDEGGSLEPGYGITKDMAMIVFGESWQLRSQLKADIRVQVRNLEPMCQNNGTRQASIHEQITSWTSDGSYLHDIVPDSNEQVHFGHPIIASTCRSFYFDRWSDISTFDRDTFHGSVPKPLVALYRNALDEWASGSRSTVKLETKPYTNVYNEILNKMKIVDEHEHYGPLLRERLAAWAGFGMSTSSSRPSSSIPVNIHLNLSPPAR